MRALVVGCLTASLLAACGSRTTTRLDSTALRDPETCRECHQTQYEQWAGSMHAYASDDPVFLAMNARAQRETAGAVGKACANCHAPVAVRDGLTTDGLNVATLPQKEKGVTCYFCHAVESIAGTHDNPLVLAADDSLFGPFGDAIAGAPHVAKTSAIFDDTTPDSAAMCGSCHDIVNTHGAHVERTFTEWQGTVFSKPGVGLSCPACHMEGSDGIAAAGSTRTRRLHRHDLPAVDLALTTWPDADGQRTRAQALLDATVQSTICWNQVSKQIEVTLDNVGAGHGWPSGATPDRRAWVEVQAFAGGQSIYSSGGDAAQPLESSPDPDLWLVRDCLKDPGGAETHLFWQAASETDNQLPGSASSNVNDPASFAGHRRRSFPSTGAGLAQTPDRITVAVHLQAIGADVLDDLVASKDLDAAVAAKVARYDLAGAALEWTTATAKLEPDATAGFMKACVTGGRYSPMTTPAETHARCAP